VAAMLRPIRLQCGEVRISAVLPFIYICTVFDHMYTQFRLASGSPERNRWAARAVLVLSMKQTHPTSIRLRLCHLLASSSLSGFELRSTSSHPLALQHTSRAVLWRYVPVTNMGRLR
jgi:hypothetical protein